MTLTEKLTKMYLRRQTVDIKPAEAAVVMTAVIFAQFVQALYVPIHAVNAWAEI